MKTEAERILEEFYEAIGGAGEYEADPEVEIVNGNITFTFEDGSYLNFTEPKAFKGEE